MEFPERRISGDRPPVDIVVARNHEQSFRGTFGRISNLFEPSLGPCELLRTAVVRNVACNQDGIELRAPLFSEIGEQRFAYLNIPIELGTCVHSCEMKIRQMQKL